MRFPIEELNFYRSTYSGSATQKRVEIAHFRKSSCS
jgi:hypothetical protein